MCNWSWPLIECLTVCERYYALSSTLNEWWLGAWWIDGRIFHSEWSTTTSPFIWRRLPQIRRSTAQPHVVECFFAAQAHALHKNRRLGTEGHSILFGFETDMLQTCNESHRRLPLAPYKSMMELESRNGSFNVWDDNQLSGWLIVMSIWIRSNSQLGETIFVAVESLVTMLVVQSVVDGIVIG